MTDAAAASQLASGTAATDPGAAGPSRARRRLILAAGAALPTVYTLASGAQTAIASHLSCVGREQISPPRFTDTPDNWYRAPVNVGNYDGVPAYCVTMPQSACADLNTDWHSTANLTAPLIEPGASKARDGSVWIVQGNRVRSSSYVQITNVSRGPKHYGLVYVDQAGTVATLDPNGAINLTPVHTSCWTSVLVGRVSKLG